MSKMLKKSLCTKIRNFFCTSESSKSSGYYITPQIMHRMTPDLLLNQQKKTIKRTKTICTIGPNTCSPENAGKLIDQDVNVARLNFSHGDHEEHLEQLNGIKEALKTRPEHHTSILLDTKGPQIRTGINDGNEPIMLKRGQQLQITTDYDHKGTPSRIACSYELLPQSTAVGKKILFADGGISSVVKKIQNGIVTVEIMNDGKLGNKKNMCLPGTQVDLPTITKYDELDIVDFGLKYKVDYIAVSFSRTLSDLRKLRKFIIQRDPEHGPNVHLISKIENHEAIYNLDEIIQGSDGLMVARGDLGMQVPIQKVVLLQKYIMSKSINAGKYVNCATQMLESMQTKPRPTRAEVSDITNAVLDLTDATMTSGQTTTGLFPFQCARYLRIISQEAQMAVAYKRIFQFKKNYSTFGHSALGAIALSFERIVDIIFLQTDSISFINLIACLRPRAYICVFTDNPKVKKLTAINFGVYCFPREAHKNPEEFVKTKGKRFVRDGRALILDIKINKNDQVVADRIIKVQ